MTLMDFIKLGILRTHAQAERFALDIVDRWHDDEIPGELNDVLGLTSREYQAWTTGGVSLLTIARWQRNSHPPLDPSVPWFKTGGEPPHESVGYLAQRINKKAESRNGAKKQRRPMKKA